MKRSILFLIFSFFNIFLCFSQEILNNPDLAYHEMVQQLSSVNSSNVLGIQDMNYGLNNQSFILQMGDWNKAIVKQSKSDPGSANQSFSSQIGNNNDLSVDQTGHGNQLISFQFGYLTVEAFDRAAELNGLAPKKGKIKDPKNEEEKLIVKEKSPKEKKHGKNNNDYLVGNGNGNEIEVIQDGADNSILAIQEGDNNSISAEQNGNNNNLFIIQRGNENTVSDYKQENYSKNSLYDTIIQQGENLSITTDGVAKKNSVKNSFSQIGSNLAIVVSNEFLNPLGGLEISQKGKDMKIEISQSYFPMPKN